MDTLMLVTVVFLTRCGLGGAVGVVDAAGVGLRPTDTRGDRTTKLNLFRGGKKMPNGFGRGFGRGFGFRGGMGFGFRGSSPPWPYIGLGRGGLPRCGYFLSGAAGAPAAWPYQQPSYPPAPEFGAWQNPYSFYTEAPPTSGPAPFAPQMTPEQELDFLKGQAEAIKEQLEQIETRIQQLGSET